MRQSVVELETFYAGRLGRLTVAMVLRRLHSLWPDLSGHDVLGMGYTGPFLAPYTDKVKSVTLAMPAAQGAVVTRHKRGIISTLVQDDRLPFPDAAFDNVIVAHALEEAGDVDGLLRELWRVTMPEGRIVIIAAHRKGLWAQFDKTPFGYGRPFSRNQLRLALDQAGFVPRLGAGLLYAPPLKICARPKIAGLTERLGETLYPGLSGLIMVEAIKRLYAEQDNGRTERAKPAKAVGGGVTVPGARPAPIDRPAAQTRSLKARQPVSKSS